MQVSQPKARGLAIFQRTAQVDAHDCIDVCLIPGVLRTATVTVYINRIFTWRALPCIGLRNSTAE